ncbi:hypothetical protein ES703_44523 [subsurface metagenome]
MAKIVTRGRGIVGGVMHPKADYSRVVNCGTQISSLVAVSYTYTPRVAINTWLLGVDLWICITPGGAGPLTYFRVLSGVHRAGSFSEIEDWDNILPVFDKDIALDWRVYDDHWHGHWTMKRLFTGEGRRFGLRIHSENAGEGYAFASFEVSEG